MVGSHSAVSEVTVGLEEDWEGVKKSIEEKSKKLKESLLRFSCEL